MTIFQKLNRALVFALFCVGFHPQCGALLQGIFTSITYPHSAVAYGQVAADQPYNPLGLTIEGNRKPLEGPLAKLKSKEAPPATQPLDGPVDPESYLLGPGDLLAVYILGEIEEEFLARISADGLLRFESFGVFNTAGRVFSDVKEEILKTAKNRYRTDEIEVSLVQLRNFKASIGGMVWTPGTYTLTAADRVTVLLSEAGGFFDPFKSDQEIAPSQEKAVLERSVEKVKIADLPGYSTRRLKLFHRDGTQQNVDLLLFIRAGLPEGNPYLQDGDFLLVPPLNPKSGVLGVYGAVNQEGNFEYLEGDNLERALRLTGGLTYDAMTDSIELTRFIGASSKYETLTINLSDSANLRLPLQPDDRIFVRNKPNYHLQYQVELRGEVIKPGFYPVGVDGEFLTEVIAMAGGLTERSSLTEAVITRSAGAQEVDPEFERIRLTPIRDLKLMEYEYIKTKNREIKDRVSVNLHGLYVKGDSSQNILLRGGDIVEIPLQIGTVKVMGQVHYPGHIQFVDGKNYRYYIEESGGFAWNARKTKVRIIKATSGKWLKPGRTIIEEGDIIFVPEKPYVDNWELFKDITLVLTQFATLYLIISTTTD